MSKKITLTFLLLFVVGLIALNAKPAAIKIGSKKFTESVILGEIAYHLSQSVGVDATHLRELGGTRILWNALLQGEIDLYPEYTGTIRREILANENIPTDADLAATLTKFNVTMSPALGFNNTYAIGMKKELATKLDIHAISDLQNHPNLAFGFTNEFMDRGDGWPGLRRHYNLPQTDVRGLDHDLAYRGLESGAIDATDLYATDAEIMYYNLVTLKDDRHFFPQYDAVFLYRRDLQEKAPEIIAALKELGGKISAAEMIKMNAQAKIDKVPESAVAADFLHKEFGLETNVRTVTIWDRLLKHTLEHLVLVIISLAAAIFVAIPLGIMAAKKEKAGQVILGIVGVIQTIPSLALLVFMIPLLGIGGPPAIVALFLYSLLPIVRNTHTGIHDIAPALRESALALGLPGFAILRRIELPMAASAILTGIKTSAVINVGTATLGALIGAGGYGQPILTGIRLDDIGLILQGAVPAAVLALLVQGGFDLLELILVPKGLRLKGE
jgi:osmoprotectant transport system permease protein